MTNPTRTFSAPSATSFENVGSETGPDDDMRLWWDRVNGQPIGAVVESLLVDRDSPNIYSQWLIAELLRRLDVERPQQDRVWRDILTIVDNAEDLPPDFPEQVRLTDYLDTWMATATSPDVILALLEMDW